MVVQKPKTLNELFTDFIKFKIESGNIICITKTKNYAVLLKSDYPLIGNNLLENIDCHMMFENIFLIQGQEEIPFDQEHQINFIMNSFKHDNTRYSNTWAYSSLFNCFIFKYIEPYLETIIADQISCLKRQIRQGMTKDVIIAISKEIQDKIDYLNSVLSFSDISFSISHINIRNNKLYDASSYVTYTDKKGEKDSSQRIYDLTKYEHFGYFKDLQPDIIIEQHKIIDAFYSGNKAVIISTPKLNLLKLITIDDINRVIENHSNEICTTERLALYLSCGKLLHTIIYDNIVKQLNKILKIISRRTKKEDYTYFDLESYFEKLIHDKIITHYNIQTTTSHQGHVCKLCYTINDEQIESKFMEYEFCLDKNTKLESKPLPDGFYEI